MATSVDRQVQTVRAAKMRAAISAYLSKSESGPVPRSVMANALSGELSGLGYNASSLDNFLYTMSKSGLVHVVKDAQGRVLGYTIGKALVTSPRPVAAKKKKAAQPAAIVVDVIKATGRVRISLAGMTIEIGVEG